ncbi:MAG: hypothetical protein M3N18_02125 [Actinomycetota bacterium]|nr:hypothetical protein [Actinomycetota bacterium]
MIDQSLAQPAPPSTLPPLRLSGRLQRGLDLAEERFEEIVRIRPYIWSVPSCSGTGVYVVNLATSECSCPDRPPEGERCKHVSAAAYKKAKTATCSGCRKRFRHRDLYEVNEDHGSLTWFVGVPPWTGA